MRLSHEYTHIILQLVFLYSQVRHNIHALNIRLWIMRMHLLTPTLLDVHILSNSEGFSYLEHKILKSFTVSRGRFFWKTSRGIHLNHAIGCFRASRFSVYKSLWKVKKQCCMSHSICLEGKTPIEGATNLSSIVSGWRISHHDFIQSNILRMHRGLQNSTLLPNRCTRRAPVFSERAWIHLNWHCSLSQEALFPRFDILFTWEVPRAYSRTRMGQNLWWNTNGFSPQLGWLSILLRHLKEGKIWKVWASCITAWDTTQVPHVKIFRN